MDIPRTDEADEAPLLSELPPIASSEPPTRSETSPTSTPAPSPAEPGASSPSDPLERLIAALTEQLLLLRSATQDETALLTKLTATALNFQTLETDRQNEHSRQITSLQELRAELKAHVDSFLQPITNAVTSLLQGQRAMHDASTTLERHVKETLSALDTAAAQQLQALTKTAEARLAQLRAISTPSASASPSRPSWPWIALILAIATALGSWLGTSSVRASLDRFTVSLTSPHPTSPATLPAGARRKP
jgi:hypothetical protein